ncbi:Rne/Rng family ribonuclease, partial [Eubacteriales bacterium OttesenSCG-928-M02]|nr:Rne/Rng family ribonuclease [Eubacteriales bacterium OttesenSCG-928-M02]
MYSRIYLDANPYEVRVAVVEDGNLAELYVERKGKERTVGNIYKGKVKNVLPGMQAAFVDIGLERNAFLYAGDISIDAIDEEDSDGEEAGGKPVPDIKKLVKVGQEVMVQILKEPFGTKGARVTTNVTLPGYMTVLLPTANYIGISRKIEDEGERERLKGILERIKPDGQGIIARTSAMGATEAELAEQINAQYEDYKTMLRVYQESGAPSLVHSEEDIYHRTVRDAFSDEVGELLVSDKNAYVYIRSLVAGMRPHLLERVKLFSQPYDMFEHHGLEGRIQKALMRRVQLKSGGYLVIDTAEALTVVDVNTGKYIGKNDLEATIRKTNVEAAEEVARQLRLRDISGIIVVDFIDMEEAESRDRLMEVLREAVKRDRTRTVILGMTDLGIVEITRKKTKQSLASIFYAPCPYCEGQGVILSTESMALRARKEVMKRYYEGTDDAIVIQASSAVCAEIVSKMRVDAVLIPPHPD